MFIILCRLYFTSEFKDKKCVGVLVKEQYYNVLLTCCTVYIQYTFVYGVYVHSVCQTPTSFSEIGCNK